MKNAMQWDYLPNETVGLHNSPALSYQESVKATDHATLKSKSPMINHSVISHTPMMLETDYTHNGRVASEPQRLDIKPPPRSIMVKTRITIMLDKCVIQAFKAKSGGKGYQTLINDTLRRALETEGIEEETPIVITLDESVIKALKAKSGGKSYQTLINDTLRRALEADSLKEALREVIKEEFQHPRT